MYSVRMTDFPVWTEIDINSELQLLIEQVRASFAVKMEQNFHFWFLAGPIFIFTENVGKSAYADTGNELGYTKFLESRSPVSSLEWVVLKTPKIVWSTKIASTARKNRFAKNPFHSSRAFLHTNKLLLPCSVDEHNQSSLLRPSIFFLFQYAREVFFIQPALDPVFYASCAVFFPETKSILLHASRGMEKRKTEKGRKKCD